MTEWTVGCHVVLKTILGEEINSVIFAYDKNTNFLLLKEPGSNPGVSNLRFLKANYVKKVISATKPETAPDLKLPYVDVERCKKREEKALKQAAMEASRVGVNVTKEAQALFDALVKTMPCRWDEQTIIILEEVSIVAPYTADECTSDETHQPTLLRVKKVVEAERARLGLT